MYEGMYTEVISTNRFDEDTNLSTTYLGQVDMARDTEVKAEESFAHDSKMLYQGTIVRWYRL